MKHRVDTLEGALLEMGVAIATGDAARSNFVMWPPPGRFPLEPRRPALEFECDPDMPAHDHDFKAWKMWQTLDYSTDWSQGGPLVERERIAIMPREEGDPWRAAVWLPPAGSGVMVYGTGPTPLIAAMRAYVASKLGEEVDLP
jgi:hypothetical protein